MTPTDLKTQRKSEDIEMTIHNRKLAEEYYAAKESRVFREALIARAADDAMGNLMKYVETYSSLKCAGDDRAMNLELAIYEYLRASNDPH